MGDEYQRTYLGGVSTFIVKLGLLYIAIDRGHQMLWQLDPNISTLNKGYDYHEHQNDTVPIGDMSKTMLYIFKGEGDSPWDTVPLNKESEQYVRVNLINRINSYNKAGEKETENKIYKAEKCSEEFFKTEFESKFYQNEIASNKTMYCAHNENIYFQGTRDSGVYKMKDVFMIWEITRCTPALGHQGCADEKDIDDWLHNKRL